MPRRKNARQVQARAKPKLPEGSLDSSMTVDEKRQKLETYLKDFDIEAEGRMHRMKAFSNALINKIKSAFKMEILKYPSHVRNMKMSDFLGQGGQVNDAALKEASNVLSELANSVFQNVPKTSDRVPLTEVVNTDVTPAPTTKRKRGKVTEEESASTARPTRSTRKRKGVPMSPSTSEKQAKAKAAKTDDHAMPPPMSTGLRSMRRNQTRMQSQFTTPAVSKLPENNQTPFVTPKFDPRLPMTPALLREAKAGERIMSLSGSPLTNRGASDSVEAFIPVGDGKTFQVSAIDNMSPRSVPQLDDTARKNIEMLQMQLARLLKIPSQLANNK